MRIGLKNVAVKVERKHPHDCIISIGRLNDVERCRLLNMFPEAIHSLQRRQSYEPFYQMTINMSLPNDEFIIHDSDECDLTIMDHMIISQTNSSYATPCQRNWFGSSDSESPNDESISKEKTDIIIDLKNVAVKVEHQNPNDYCMISIGRLNSFEKEALLTMFPTAINTLRSRPTIPIADDLYQMTITVNLPPRPDSKICDSDVCQLSIMDRMIITQTELTDVGFLYYWNWFDSDDSDPDKSDSDNEIKKVRLSYVAVKVAEWGDCNCVRIGRISDSEKVSLEQILPANMLNFKASRLPNSSIERYEVEFRVPSTDIEDSNYCTIDILYDKRHPNFVFISHQHIIENNTALPWFDSNSNDSNSDSVMAKETVTLTSVAVKLVHKQGLYRSIQIGRISESEVERLKQILPSNMLNFKSHTIISAIRPDGDVYYYEMDLSASAMGVVDSNNCNIDISCDEKKPDSIYVTNQRCLKDELVSPWFLSIAQRLAPPRVSIPDELVEPAKQIIDQIKKEETEMKPQIVALSCVSVKVSPSSKTITIGRISESEKLRIGQTFPSNMLHWKSRKSVDANFYELTLKYSDAPIDIGDSNECTLTISYKKPDSVCILQQIRTVHDNVQTWFSSEKEETNMTTSALEKCIINDNATIMFWSDGTKTVTKTTPGDAYDPEIGIAMGIAKKLFGSKHKFDKYVNSVVSDMYKREVTEFTEKELLDALAENEKIMTNAKAKHKAEKEAYFAAKNDPNHEGKLPELHSLKGDHSYRFAKIRKDIIMAEIEKRTTKKAAKAKTKAKAKSKTRARKKKPETEK